MDPCPICLDEMSPNTDVQELSCHHRYHSKCIITALRIDPRCPVCRDPGALRRPPPANIDWTRIERARLAHARALVNHRLQSRQRRDFLLTNAYGKMLSRLLTSRRESLKYLAAEIRLLSTNPAVQEYAKKTRKRAHITKTINALKSRITACLTANNIPLPAPEPSLQAFIEHENLVAQQV